MPSASVSTATAVKAGFFSSWRQAKRRSFIVRCQWSGKAPNPKFQTPNKSQPQIPNIESTALAGVWSLIIGVSLGFGAWFLELSFVSQRLHRIDFGGAARRD